ncbi:GNAT family N-acetyltransferase [Clostridium pasteurianum]|uniref:Acetyltransferase (GNAT) family protein n=1 Tax=Clostridium pasteurianum BC1 TaxID=86416 RepID=R4K8X9_CLOPA|nr:GNAT family N-acetyltransferase [Clostridium pasteurianum]AGK96085.1 acetyltransferase (GNAT) family protein [Clostridium pasteurianum BC1]
MTKSHIAFRELHSGEEDTVCKLVIDCFNHFIAPEYPYEGVREFINYVKPDLLKERLKNISYSFVALYKDEIVGAIEVRNANHISLLFVKKEYQRIGIAKNLLKISLDKSKNIDDSISEIEVNSSPYAVEIYKSMDFIETDVEQVVNGIKFIPMKLVLS